LLRLAQGKKVEKAEKLQVGPLFGQKLFSLYFIRSRKSHKSCKKLKKYSKKLEKQESSASYVYSPVTVVYMMQA
jgi:hypothetical protein